jgi:hypothetical protein
MANSSTTVRTEFARKTILSELASGKSLSSICRREDMPSITAVMEWLREDELFQRDYMQSREMWSDAVFEEIFDIADDGRNDWIEENSPRGGTVIKLNSEHINRSRLRIDVRRWALARMNPKKYGELTAVEVTGKDGTPLMNNMNEIQLADAAAKIVTAIGAAVSRKKQLEAPQGQLIEAVNDGHDDLI